MSQSQHPVMETTPNVQPSHPQSHSTGTDAEDTPTEVLEVIREEQVSPVGSNGNIETKKSEEECSKVMCDCTCTKAETQTNMITPEELETILKENEANLRNEYDKRLDKEIVFVKDRFDFILSNEQTRASYMLREAYRERKEKITALQTQLECKNLAGLMYVMCSERRRSKLERQRLVEEYTNYIRTLQDILTEGQALILHLSRGYKTAARVDNEWRVKMKKIVQEFMAFICHYTECTPESNQYLFDLPRLLRTKASIVDDPKEDPCEPEEQEGEGEEEYLNAEAQGDKSWWDRLDNDSRPFVMYGDISEFKPNRRREVLKAVKAAKTAPRKWKEYVFNEMCLKADCPNSDVIKDLYPEPSSQKWECSLSEGSPQDASKKQREPSIAPTSRRATTQSIDIRGDMGSLLKIITSTNIGQQAQKTTLLGARDSMEIQSTTKLRVKSMQKIKLKQVDIPESPSTVKINVGKRRTSLFDDFNEEEDELGEGKSENRVSEDDNLELGFDPVGEAHNDSLHVLPNQPKADRKDRINYEKVCPMEKCKLKQVDSFIRSLPPYMRVNPYTHFEQSFQEYEPCTPEQLEILKQRIAAKQAKEHPEVPETCPLDEWTPSVLGVETQTSQLSIDLPPCTCDVPSPTPSNGMVFRVEDLMPMKKVLECISKACFFDSNIQFDRFKVIGEGTRDNANGHKNVDFKERRYLEIRKILKQHPSLLEIFQANTRC